MNQVHLHYTTFPTGYFAVSASGLTVSQLTNYAKKSGFIFVSAPHETQMLVANHTIQQSRLFHELVSLGYEVKVTMSDLDIFPPMPSIDPSYFDEEAEIIAEIEAIAEWQELSGEADEIEHEWRRIYGDDGDEGDDQ